MPGQVRHTFAERFKRRHCIVGEKSVLLPTSRVENFLRCRDAISVGENTIIGGQLLVFAHGGKIEVGSNCFVGENARIWSAEAVSIGDRVLISHGVNIHDTDSHAMSAKRRHEHILSMFATGHPVDLPDVTSKPIRIDDDAWIGFNSVILKGVRVGRGAIVGAASVVCHDVPAYSIVVGNPARLIGTSLP